MSNSVYVPVLHDLELLRYVLHCAIERLLSFPTGMNKVYCYCCYCYGTFLTCKYNAVAKRFMATAVSIKCIDKRVCVCVHACVCICIHVFAIVYTYVCASACMCVCVHVAASSSFQQHTRLKPHLSLGADNPALLGRHSMRFR